MKISDEAFCFGVRYIRLKSRVEDVENEEPVTGDETDEDHSPPTSGGNDAPEPSDEEERNDEPQTEISPKR